MSQDKLERHRRAEKRNPNAFHQWLETNCHKAVPHEQLKNISEEKKKIIEKVISESS